MLTTCEFLKTPQKTCQANFYPAIALSFLPYLSKLDLALQKSRSYDPEFIFITSFPKNTDRTCFLHFFASRLMVIFRSTMNAKATDHLLSDYANVFLLPITEFSFSLLIFTFSTFLD